MSSQAKIVTLLSVLVAVNALVWLLTWGAAQTHALLLSAGLLAYGFGLRHAVDADHIAAIDNTTRKLMSEGKRPLGVGFFFSLGHSTVVLLLCAALALSASYVERHLPQWRSVGGVAGTLISAFFLYVIGAVNLVVLFDLFRVSRRGAEGDSTDENAEEVHAPSGLLGRLFRPLLRMIRASWQMYFIGFLFGLGFDTASEIGILALSAHTGQAGMPLGAIMLLPLLFTAGMCLVDTLDGVLMLGAYGWAFVRPARKVYYNLCITALSVLVAFVIGTYELAQILHPQFAIRGGEWKLSSWLRYDNLGFVIIGTFLLGWMLSMFLANGSSKFSEDRQSDHVK